MEQIAGILSAMITPAVLISACGTLIMSTSQRLGRSTDRVRSLTRRFKELVSERGQDELLAREEKRLIISQLPRITRRVRLIQRALTAFYASVGVLVLASVLTGSSLLLHLDLAAWPVVFALLGTGFLMFGAILLTFEAQLSYQVTRAEMRFLEQMGQHYAVLYRDEPDPTAD
ncbi:DUF2721 domain-containing protein [Deinococcus sonorensis]|uniref:DUF2721 domain-containing protein n=2 Tax=Deinococcus sonorensis TaxID=309891 RepID=A0AAU7U890_9DEIO